MTDEIKRAKDGLFDALVDGRLSDEGYDAERKVVDAIDALIKAHVADAMRNVVVSTEEDIDSINDAVDQYGWAGGDESRREAVWEFMQNVNGALKVRT